MLATEEQTLNAAEMTQEVSTISITISLPDGSTSDLQVPPDFSVADVASHMAATTDYSCFNITRNNNILSLTTLVLDIADVATDPLLKLSPGKQTFISFTSSALLRD